MNVIRVDACGMLREYDAGLDAIEKDMEIKASIDLFGPSSSERYAAGIGMLLAWLRSAVGADGGALYVLDGYVLRYAHVQNDTLNQDGALLGPGGKSVFLANGDMIGKRSAYGYSAVTGKALAIDDTGSIPNKMPFHVSIQHDLSSTYRSVSLMCVPITFDEGGTAGILQLMNKVGPDGLPVPFSDDDIALVGFFLERRRELLSDLLSRCLDDMARSSGDDRSGRAGHASLAPQGTHSLPWLRGSGISWTEGERIKESAISMRISAFTDYIYGFKDFASIMDLILTEARDATGADAGTFYLVERKEWLRFAYVHNETLFRDGSMRHIYVDSLLPITGGSISGYVADRRRMLNIRDAWNLPLGAAYGFDKSFDEASGYRTVSMLAIPILEPGGATVAVIQLINSKDPQGRVRAFDKAAELYAGYLAKHIAPYLLRSVMSERSIRKMLRMIELHNPYEGNDHVMRVSYAAAEIYARWAEKRNIPSEDILAGKDILRLAAMYHDIGMVSVPDSVIKKKTPLFTDEKLTIERHCAVGASIFDVPDSDVEAAAFDITMHHHQRWDGAGYTGTDKHPALSGEEIPVFARMTSVADTLDALVSPRAYKKQWTFAGAMDQLKKCAGTQLDPAAVEAAVEIEDTLRAIFGRYRPKAPKGPIRREFSPDEMLLSDADEDVIWIA